MTSTASRSKPSFPKDWLKAIGPEFDKPYMASLRNFLKEEIKTKTIYPKSSEIFAAFQKTPFDSVKVVILGQDPYHGPDQAHGLSFSVKPGIKPPPSLVNIYKELASDLHLDRPNHGFLESWATQGVLLLNSVLTVEGGQAASHQKKGWETFTDHIIETLATQKENIVFILWGSYAQKKGEKIDREKHLVLTAPHPSPLSSHRGFMGSKPFSKTNAHLIRSNKSPIHWQLPMH